MALRRCNTKTKLDSADSSMDTLVKAALGGVPSRDDEVREPQPDPPTPPTDVVEASTTTEEVVNDDKSNTGETQEAGHIVSTAVAKVCGTCGRMTTDYSVNHANGVRCKPCNRLKSRMQRAMAADGALREKWNGLSKQARDDWVRDAGQRCEVEGLAKAMYICIEKSRQTSTEVKSGFKKLYFDSPDLRARYKGKDEQLIEVKNEHQRSGMKSDRRTYTKTTTTAVELTLWRATWPRRECKQNRR